MTTSWSSIPQEWRERACAHPGSILLESSLPCDTEHRSFLFTEPERILTASAPGDLPQLFREIENQVANGRWAAGYVAYEAGAHFLDLPSTDAARPLAIVGIFAKPQIFHHHVESDSAVPQPTQLHVAPIPQITVAEYHQSIQQIKEWIAAGDTYQVNYTAQLQSPCPHTPLQVYEALRAQQPSSYAAIVNLPDQPVVLSLSPELFFRVDTCETISTRPMKGTAPRGITPEEDQRLASALQQDEKNRAEHVMIVDLLRNDLNRICRTGTVRVDDLFRVEQYQTLHQMTSRISGILQPHTTWYEVFRALFPGGSIVGAPKRHTARLIQQVERTPRGVYTGAIGYFAPDRTAAFNIAIRTAVLHLAQPQQTCCPDRSATEPKDLHSVITLQDQGKSSTLALGVGGGIVADSTATSEYTEALLKAAFVRRAAQPYGLIETMRAQQGAIPFLDAHLQRLTDSAEALGFACNAEAIRRELTLLQPHGRVRLHLTHEGQTEIATSVAPVWPAELHLALSPIRTDATSPHLRHKTTFRPEYSLPIPAGAHDTLFQNMQGELTESSIANLLVQIDGLWYTPRLASGVLPGIMRAHLLQTGQVQERTLKRHDLQRSEAAALCNALRGIAPVRKLQLEGDERIHWEAPASMPQPTLSRSASAR